MTSMHRVAIGYLVIPFVLWALIWCELYISLPIAVLAGILFVNLARGITWSITKTQIMVLVAGMLLAGVSRAFGVFDQYNGDWVKHFGILQALVDGSWPVQIGEEYLRYYMGYYIVPAGVAKIFGYEVLRFALGLWTGLGIGLFLLLLTRRMTFRMALVVVGLVVIFSGVDYLKALGDFLPEGLVYHLEPITVPLDTVRELSMRDGTTFIEGEIWSLQISSFATLLMFVPQHLISGMIGAMLLIHLSRNPEYLKYSLLVIAACAFWSPFVAIGLAILQLVQTRDFRQYISGYNLAAIPIGILLLLYISAGPRVGELWIAQRLDVYLGILMLWLEIGALLAILIWIRPSLLRSRLFLASVASIIGLSFLHFGYFNDLLMRGTIPAMTVLLYYLSRLIRKWANNQIAPLPKSVLTMVLLLALIGPVVEYVRSIGSASTVDLVFHWNYAAEIEPNMVQYLADKTAILEMILR